MKQDNALCILHVVAGDLAGGKLDVFVVIVTENVGAQPVHLIVRHFDIAPCNRENRMRFIKAAPIQTPCLQQRRRAYRD